MLEQNTIVYVVMEHSSRDLDARIKGIFLTEQLAENYINNYRSSTFCYVEKHIVIGEAK